MSSKKNRSFVLRDIDTDEVDKKYDIKLVSNISTIDDFIPQNTTKLSELTDKTSSDIVSFLDESKRLHKCFVTMIDFKTNNEHASFCSYNCFWCRHGIETKPLGCPIRYISRSARKVYNSEISKENYTIKENITESKQKIINESNKISPTASVITSKVDVCSNNYYSTFGVFCSFNCIMAYILENKHNRLFDLSSILLLKMYNEILNIKNSQITLIKPAPHWTLLVEYGGTMTIKEFRQSFNRIEYEHHGHVKNFPEFLSIGDLYEQKIKF
jgi:hypothetical protein